MVDPIVDTWSTHTALNLYLIVSIPAEALAASPFGKGRTIGQVVAHIHNNRLDWLRVIAPDISQDMKKVARNESDDKELSLRALNGSAEAVTIVLQRSLDTGGKVKGFWDHAAKFLGYLIAHEAYHHGEIGIMITQAGFQLPQDIAYGIWDWKKK